MVKSQVGLGFGKRQDVYGKVLRALVMIKGQVGLRYGKSSSRTRV